MDTIPYLAVSATYKDGEVTLCVINRNKEEMITTDIILQSGAFSGKLDVYEVNGPDINAGNDLNKEVVKTDRNPSLNASSNTITYSFPSHSFTMIKGKMANE